MIINWSVSLVSVEFWCLQNCVMCIYWQCGIKSRIKNPKRRLKTVLEKWWCGAPREGCKTAKWGAAGGVPQTPRVVQGVVHTPLTNSAFQAKPQTVQIKLQLHRVRRDLDLNMPFVLGWVRWVLFCCLIELAARSCPSPAACHSPSPSLPLHHRCFGVLKSAHLAAHTVAFLEPNLSKGSGF